jgi:hypothetical protein
MAVSRSRAGYDFDFAAETVAMTPAPGTTIENVISQEDLDIPPYHRPPPSLFTAPHSSLLSAPPSPRPSSPLSKTLEDSSESDYGLGDDSIFLNEEEMKLSETLKGSSDSDYGLGGGNLIMDEEAKFFANFDIESYNGGVPLPMPSSTNRERRFQEAVEKARIHAHNSALEAAGIEPIRLPEIPLSPEQDQVLQMVLTGKNVFFTGPAGTGKSLILRHVKYHLQKSGKKFAITAPTGIAAVQLGGTTIHSFSGVGYGNRGLRDYRGMSRSKKTSVGKKYMVWRTTDVLIIDEISMVSFLAKLFDFITSVFLTYYGKIKVKSGSLG